MTESSSSSSSAAAAGGGRRSISTELRARWPAEPCERTCRTRPDGNTPRAGRCQTPCCHTQPRLSRYTATTKKGEGSTYSTAEHRVPELIPVFDSQPAGNVSHKPGGRLPLLSARPAVTLATLKTAATNSTAW